MRIGGFELSHAPGLFLIRIPGRYYIIRDTSRHRLRFSERNGNVPMWVIRRIDDSSRLTK